MSKNNFTFTRQAHKKANGINYLYTSLDGHPDDYLEVLTPILTETTHSPVEPALGGGIE